MSRSATREEIRAAYVALMKKYHPDATGARDAAAEQAVTAINRCYAVLKDPLKRAEYDSKLGHDSFAPDKLSSRRSIAVAPLPQMSQRRWTVLLVAIGAAGAALAAEFGSQWPVDAGFSAIYASPVAGSAAPIGPVPSSDVARVLKLATRVSTEQALALSRDCFEAARSRSDPSSAQLCIIFDDAVLYWRQNANDYATLPFYYRDEVVQMRHLNALALGGNRAEKRLDELRDITFHGLLTQLARSEEVADKPAPSAIAAAPQKAQRQSETLSNSRPKSGQTNSLAVHN